jgi:catechol 2,3-dioxygenase-like lactoylglutathione lyase family enzyme
VLLRRAHHTGLTVSSLERALAFYRDVLGLELVACWLGTAPYLSQVTGFAGVQLKLAMLRVPGDQHLVELLEYVSHPGEPVPPETNRPGSRHLCFAVDDIGVCYHELTSKGIRFASEPALVTAGANRGAMAVYLRDPDGYTVELFQPAPQADRPAG